MKRFLWASRALLFFERLAAYSNHIKRLLSVGLSGVLHLCAKPLPKLFEGRRLYRSLGLLFSSSLILHICLVNAHAVPDSSREPNGLIGAVQQQRTLHGEVRGAADGQPVEGVSISYGKQQSNTGKDGKFSIRTADAVGKVVIKHLAYKTREVAFDASTGYLSIKLEAAERQIEEVEVTTGFQALPKERATGSFEFIDSALFNRKVSTDFVSRLEDVVPSISSSRLYSENKGNLLNIHVRGLSTMASEPWPLVVVDGVPYVNRFSEHESIGMFNNINPNDVESITVLKDAAASSIWGASSGNGVIVIKTKRAKYNQAFQLSFNSNLTVGDKPDLYYYPQMASRDYIEAERFLFDAGYYDNRLYAWDENLSPVIQLLKKNREDNISAQAMAAEFDRLSGVDVRDDMLKYVYRKSTKQQYNVQLRGGSEKMNTQFSLGYDKNLEDLITSSYNRLTLKNNTQLRPLKNLSLDIGITYTESKRQAAYIQTAGYRTMGRNFPYMELADKDGNALAVDAVAFSPEFRDTVAGGRLLDWKYRPLAELHDTYDKTDIRETFITTQAAYQLLPSLKVSALYAFQRAAQPKEVWKGLGSFEQRNFVNYHASWDANKVTWGVPVGDYLENQDRYNTSHQGRAQLDFAQNWADRHELNAIAGAEVRQVASSMKSNVVWGYDPETLTSKPFPEGQPVPVLNGVWGNNYMHYYAAMTDYTRRYLSYYANASYSYDKRYVLSASARTDASNQFGVRANDRFQPFWSVGGAWLLSHESFVNAEVFPLLKLRATYGYNGNTNNARAAYALINVAGTPHSVTGNPYAQMQAPPNPSLRWERVGMLNLGLDFNVKNRLSGSVEYYIKRPKDLIAASTLDPSTGYATLSVNAAELDGRGVDVSLNSLNIKKRNFTWNSNLVFAFHRTMVTKAYTSNRRSDSYRSGYFQGTMTPIADYNMYSLLTYRWAGLNPDTGMPRGYDKEGSISEDYLALVYSSTVDEMENHGSSRPEYFGSLRNSFSYKGLEFSFNMSYQLGFKFVRSSFDNRFFIQLGDDHKDYAQRWQKPGDEQRTDVPAFVYPNNAAASDLYFSSSALVERGDQIKLRDLQLSYSLPQLAKAGLKNTRVYAYAQNVGTIWRANKLGIDPEYGRSIPDPMTISLGLNFNL